MANQLPAFALASSIGSLGMDPSAGLIQGTRIPFSVLSAAAAVPAGGAIVATVNVTFPVLKANEAVLIEHVAGLIEAGDASGKLTISGVHSEIFDASFIVCLPLLVIAPQGLTLGAAVNSFAGFFVQPPLPWRVRDLREMTVGGVPPNAPVQPLGLSVDATIANSDAIGHNVQIGIAGHYRVISGVNP